MPEALSPDAYALMGLTAVIGALAAVMTFAMLRIGAAARDTRRALRGGGDSAALTAALHDAVTKMKAQERAMSARAEASERLNSEIIASLASGLLVVGLGGEVRVINPSARKLIGLGDHEPCEGYAQLGARAAPLVAVIDECLRDRRAIVRRALQLPQPGTSPAYLGVTVSPLFDESGALSGAICLFSDLTAVIELEEQVRLKDSLARVGELTAGIAHEFRNGLATIHGYSRLLDPQALTPEHRPYLEGIRAETQALGQVVTNFLNFAKPAQLTLAPVDMRAIAERAADELRPEAEARGGSITVSGTFDAVDGDDVLLRQAVSNLLRNALEACAAAGVQPAISIDAEVDRTQRVCRIVVNDNGPGIEPQARERVFRPFFTTKSNGTGLGLALVLKIIVTHNGRIAIGTSPRGGASMQIALPLGGA
jgi:signal transduction histidine kinase